MARNLFAAVVLAISTGLAGGGCSADNTAAETDPTPSSSPTTPEATPAAPATSPASVPDPPKPPKAADSSEGKKAFARHVVEAWGFALRTNNPEPVLQLSPKSRPCEGCQRLKSELRTRDRQGWYVEFPGAQVNKIDVESTGETSVATMSVALPESDSYNDDGSYRNTNPAHPNSSFEVKMRLTKGAFVLIAFSVG